MKSSFTNPSGNCVDVDTVGGMVRVRDTKNPDPAAYLEFYGEEWDAFLAGVRNGEFNFADRCLQQKPRVLQERELAATPPLKTMEQVIEGLRKLD